MSGKSATGPKRRTTMVPVTTMEEIPVLDEHERAELLAQLKESQEQIKAGHYIVYDPKKFKERMMRIYRAKKR